MLLPLLMNNLMSVPAIPAAGTPIIIKSTISIGDALPSGIDAYNVFKSEIEQADLVSGINLSMKGKSNITTNIP